MMSTDPAVKIESSRGLLVRKIAVGAGIGALAYFIPEALEVADSLRDGEPVELGQAFLSSLMGGVIGALIRGALAVGPFNFAGPTDSLHTLGKERPTTVVVDEDPDSLEVNEHITG
jgi:hypothetical protein